MDDTTDIAKVRLLRPGAATHSWDINQRTVELPFPKPSSTRLRITAPDNPNLAPPGWYMLFVVDDQARPCQMAHRIWLSPDTCEQAV